MNNPIPSIATVFSIHNHKFITYVQPAVDSGISPWYTKSNKDSPASTVLGFKLLTMKRNSATPAHVHKTKEKIYLLRKGQCDGHFVVYQHIDGEWQEFNLQCGGSCVIVQPGVVHAIYCLKDGFSGHADVMVITSNQDDGDIRWEEGKDTLLLNSHQT